MTRIILIRPGSTDFDQQRRITGTLDIPLNQRGNDQAQQAAAEIADQNVECVYCSPCRSAQETAHVLAQEWRVRIKTLRKLPNLNHGLWQGKLIDELKEKQRKVYRLWREQPETVCPPEGEMLNSVQNRVKTVLDKLIKKHKHEVVALVAPEPLTTIVGHYLEQSQLGDLWKCECECGSWKSIDIEPTQLPAMVANQT